MLAEIGIRRLQLPYDREDTVIFESYITGCLVNDVILEANSQGKYLVILKTVICYCKRYFVANALANLLFIEKYMWEAYP